MRVTRARYVTVCQQFLVTAVVIAVGLSAAGVMTLQIVTPELHDGAQGRVQATDLAPAVDVGDAYVDRAPVTPTVREIKVAPVKASARTPIAQAGPEKQAVKRLAAISAPAKVHGYATVGVTWKHGTNLAEDQIDVQVRTRKDGVWSGWSKATYHDDHGPDAGTAEAARVRPGTDAVVVGDVEEVQMRAETTDGTAPADLELAVVDPGKGKLTKAAPAIDTADLPASDRDATSAPPIEATAGDAAPASAAADDTAALMAMKVAPKPLIYSRAQWGANEALRDKSSLRYGTVKTGFIHHTVNANTYTADQVPALLRGIYAYHTQSRGWSDIGYNFLVDRFGRIWEGRYGGVDRAVVGAHTLGYNEYSFAMSAIGNFDVVQPPQAMLDAYARLFAWKLSLYDIRADASRLWVKDRYLYAINGHRDVGQTACPGRYLYAKIPSIRLAAQAIQNRAQTPVDPVTLPIVAAPAGVPAPTSTPLAAARQTVSTFQPRTSLAGSGWPDLVTKSATGTIQVVPTGGILGFGAPVLTAGKWSAMSIITAIGDVTGDGRGDVLAKNVRSGATGIYAGDGRGHVSATPVAVTYQFRYADQIIAATDFNRDGRNDLFARDARTKGLRVYLGLGGGRFAAGKLIRASWPHPLTVAAGDLTGDGRVDYLLVRADRRVVLMPGLGGTTGATAFRPGVGLMTLPAMPTTVLAGSDLNGDRLPDLVVRYGNGLTSLYAGAGGARFGQVWGSFRTFGAVSRLSSAQMAGSAAYDAVGRDAAGRLAVFSVNGRANLSAPLPANLKVPGANQLLQVGDWDRNGTADLIVRDSNRDRLVLWPGLGNGKFGQGRSLGTGWRTLARLTPVGDVTGDGYPDLLGRISGGRLTIFPGAGLKAFKAPVLAPSSFRTFNQIGSASWTTTSPVLASVTDPSFVPLAGTDLESALRAANGQTAAIYDAYVGVGDVDGDGIADALAREKGTGTLWLLPGKTSGGLAPRMWVANGFAGYQLIG